MSWNGSQILVPQALLSDPEDIGPARVRSSSEPAASNSNIATALSGASRRSFLNTTSTAGAAASSSSDNTRFCILDDVNLDRRRLKAQSLSQTDDLQGQTLVEQHAASSSQARNSVLSDGTVISFV